MFVAIHWKLKKIKISFRISTNLENRGLIVKILLKSQVWTIKRDETFPSRLSLLFYFENQSFENNSISTRLFLALPAAVLFVAIGLSAPKPNVCKDVAGTPLFTK